MSDHTVEPWSFELDKDYTNTDQDLVYGSIIGDDYHIARVWTDSPDPEANARRIVACVNACVGIDTVTLESLVYSNLPTLKNCATALLQRDQLLVALKNIAEYWNRDENELTMAAAHWNIIYEAEAAIQSIEEFMK